VVLDMQNPGTVGAAVAKVGGLIVRNVYVLSFTWLMS
jgi:hypothetical protein